jgi:hypothetical protein
MTEDALCPSGCKSIVDTGTYLIYGPSDQLQSFLSDMTIQNCSEKHNLPNLGFMFKGFTKNGKDTAFELILTPDDYVLEFDVDGKNDCVVGIGSDNEDSGWTLGQVFLKAYYTVFDRDNEAVGFVKSNPSPQIMQLETGTILHTNDKVQTNSGNSMPKKQQKNDYFSYINSFTQNQKDNTSFLGMYNSNYYQPQNQNNPGSGELHNDDTILSQMNSFLR